MTKLLISAVILAASGLALAKLPPLDDAAKAKAAEAAAKAGWQGKVDAYQLCKVQDKIAARYKSSASKPADAKPAAVPVSAQPASGTPAVAAAPPACAEPGPFTYNAPEQKPLETSGAHSPAGNATSPPSVRSESAKMAPSK